MPNDDRREAVIAYVSLVERAVPTEEEITALAKDRLAAYKVPRSVFIIHDLPKTHAGKIQRQVLRGF
ncbi:AMP-binding enzyme [Calidifontibacter indicus]|uniref:AMP-binding enzyme n=1 Tax=Calidifontibacter indicus TaxID=419650 RepID=UPI003D752EEA